MFVEWTKESLAQTQSLANGRIKWRLLVEQASILHWRVMELEAEEEEEEDLMTGYYTCTNDTK